MGIATDFDGAISGDFQASVATDRNNWISDTTIQCWIGAAGSGEPFADSVDAQLQLNGSSITVIDPPSQNTNGVTPGDYNLNLSTPKILQLQNGASPGYTGLVSFGGSLVLNAKILGTNPASPFNNPWYASGAWCLRGNSLSALYNVFVKPGVWSVVLQAGSDYTGGQFYSSEIGNVSIIGTTGVNISNLGINGWQVLNPSNNPIGSTLPPPPNYLDNTGSPFNITVPAGGGFIFIDMSQFGTNRQDVVITVTLTFLHP
jgi:hypothetical protein